MSEQEPVELSCGVDEPSEEAAAGNGGGDGPAEGDAQDPGNVDGKKGKEQSKCCVLL